MISSLPALSAKNFLYSSSDVEVSTLFIFESFWISVVNSAKVSYPTNECVRNGDKCEEYIVPYSQPKAEEKATEQKENNSGSKIYLGNLLFVMLLFLF